MRVLRLPSAGGFSTVAALLVVCACGGPANNSALFSSGGAPSFVGAGGGVSESGSNNASGGSPGAGGNAGAVSGASGAMTSGGASGSPTGGASGAGGTGGAGAGGTSGGGGVANGGGGTGSTLSDCAMFGNDASYYSETKHCYLVVKLPATFALAKNHCMILGAHLVTLSSQPENDFVWGLDNNEHWIGATDGKGTRDIGAGNYAWVDGEPFSYTDWSAGQPNASPTPCADGMSGGTCYEHCAFQWADGGRPGEWNDRLCTHMIDAVCEWDG